MVSRSDMRVLFDLVHPAHVHFYRHLIAELQDRGAATHVVSRHKDVTGELLDSFGIPHFPVGRPRSRGRVSQARELGARVSSLVGISRDFRPDLICTRNPAGVIAGHLLNGVRTVFDTDDGAAAGLHYRLAARADVITMPECLTPTAPDRTRRYPSYKALAYLHPRRYEPTDVRAELRLDDRPIHVVRLVSMQASHDHGESGMPEPTRRQLIEVLAERGHLYISSEAPLPAELAGHRLPLPPDRLHDLLASADLYVGDSQTVAAEAALLGTPTVHVSSWSRRLAYLVELEDRYRLLESYKPGEHDRFLDAVHRLSADPEALRGEWARRRATMLGERVDLTSWYLELLGDLAP